MYGQVAGANLVVSWVNSMLFILEIVQWALISLFSLVHTHKMDRVISYYSAFKNDALLLKATVGSCFILDTICTVASYIGG